MQVVELMPGVFGPKTMLAELVMSPLVMVGAVLQAPVVVAVGITICDWPAATAELVYAFASAWQAPSAERMR